MKLSLWGALPLLVLGCTGPTIPLETQPLPPATREERAALQGTTVPGAEVQVLLDDGTAVTAETLDGQWQAWVPLHEGMNRFEVNASSSEGAAVREVWTRRVAFRTIAHRGASVLGPENTLAAFGLALQHGADDLEMDVQRSADGRAMVIHDATTGRTANVDLVVKESSSLRLRELDVGAYRGAEFAGEQIPFLEEALALLSARHRAWVELKSGEDVAAAAAEAIESSAWRHQIDVESFSLPALMAFRELAPEVPLWLIRSAAPSDDELDQLVRAGCKGLVLQADAITESLLEKAYARDLGVVAWTVNDVGQADRLRASFVEGVMTDRPELISGLSQLRSPTAQR